MDVLLLHLHRVRLNCVSSCIRTTLESLLKGKRSGLSNLHIALIDVSVLNALDIVVIEF